MSGVKVTKDEVVAFRLDAQNLNRRVGEEQLLAAAGNCGVQNSPPGSALLALNARVQAMSEQRLETAVSQDRSLLQSWSMRGAPFFFPTRDLPIFATGVLPPSEGARRHFLLGVEPSLDDLGMELGEVLELVQEHITEVLAGRRLTVTDLGAELAARISPALPERKRTVWEQEGPYSKGQPLGEGVIHFCLRILTLEKVICFAPREGSKAPFVLLDEWLDSPVPEMSVEDARAQLLHRYLHVYGPSTRGDFASWLGIRASGATPWWDLLEGEMSEVDFGRRTWILTEDVDSLQSPPSPSGVRLLPPRDPYIQGRDRETIVDKQFHREVFKTVGEPGTALVDGRIVGTWRAPKKGRRQTMTITTFEKLSAKDRRALGDEANDLAPQRGADTIDVDFDTA